MTRLKDRVAIVTGGARGIGEACARRIATEGASVVITDLSGEGEAVAQAIRDEGGQALFIAGDASDSALIEQLVRNAEARFGVVDACVCAAGIAPDTDFLAVSQKEFLDTQRINVVAPFLLGQAVARRLVERGIAGAIVNITSTSARLAGGKQASYCSSKAGLDGLTRAMAIALAPHNIRVNALGPGPTLTGMVTMERLEPTVVAPLLARTPLGRFAQPSEQASVVAFLLSDEASFMTGETIYCDGGRLALQYTMPPRA